MLQGQTLAPDCFERTGLSACEFFPMKNPTRGLRLDMCHIGLYSTCLVVVVASAGLDLAIHFVLVSVS